jgi:hypothetical protein
MIQSTVLNTELPQQIIDNFELTKNIPIDTRFLLSYWDDLNTDIPVTKRYPGLIFFVNEGAPKVGVDTTNDTYIGKFYIFESQDGPAIPLTNIWDRYEILMITAYRNNTYANLLADLNKTFPKIGRCVYLTDVEICVVYVGNSTWRYLSGSYKIPTKDSWGTFPSSLKVPKKSVTTTNDNASYIIYDNLTLSLPIEVITATPFQEGHYYQDDNFFYFYLTGKMRRLTDKTFLSAPYTFTAQKTELTLKHNFNSYYVTGFMMLHSNANYPRINAQILPLNMEIIDLNNVKISISQPIANQCYFYLTSNESDFIPNL